MIDENYGNPCDKLYRNFKYTCGFVNAEICTAFTDYNSLYNQELLKAALHTRVHLHEH